jgi:hypothetical protein
MSVVQLGVGNRRQTDLTTFDCSLSNSATHPLILGRLLFFTISLMRVGFQRSIPSVTVQPLVAFTV